MAGKDTESGGTLNNPPWPDIQKIATDLLIRKFASKGHFSRDHHFDEVFQNIMVEVIVSYKNFDSNKGSLKIWIRYIVDQ